MSNAQVSSANANQAPEMRSADFKLEVVVLPVSDVDRAKQFYEMLGWRLDADFATGEDYRIVQMTPPGSQASVHFGTGVTDAAPGSIERTVLVVDDIETARAELVARGVDVSEVFHGEDGLIHHAGAAGRVPGPDLERGSYGSGASFTDPDGNGWLLQEITTRLPGRVSEVDVATLAPLLLETAMAHHHVETAAAAHDWWDWYAPYLHARERGSSSEEATELADDYLKEVRGVAVPR
jgi:catechol 2,3-dioxygenase-like lactoylglutathione lyase family enzyme